MNFIMKKLMQRQLKNLPKDQQEKIMRMIERDPEFFNQISKEIKEKTKAGVDQQSATMQVMFKHQAKMQKLMAD